MPKEKPPANDAFSLLSSFGPVPLIIGTYLYFVGYTYIYFFLHHFNISTDIMDIPFYHYIVYSYNTIVSVGSLITLIIIIPMLYLISYLHSYKKSIYALFFILLFLVLFILAHRVAYKDALQIRLGNAKLITFIIKNDVEKYYPKQFIDANKKGKLKIITQGKDRFYVLLQQKGEDDEIPVGYVFDIPRTDILLAEIETENISRKGGFLKWMKH